ncbi:diphosphate--fructose-6-phosphate 1-phosphotransferase [Dendrosporobacter sp. 1207_IL3150]|uniref:diphosphate--fructose-6-phosphate 1-phosphotransferase n=1 Tax=Dendrosporobacter sp. 1207_IL3150 TaxID=3084054 RepID=UPI002FD8EEB7
MMTIPSGYTLAILCGGGPAPGINSVISAVTIEAEKYGWKTLGIFDGFSHLAQGDKKVLNLTTDIVSRIHLEGGSILRMSRFNPTKNAADLAKVVETLIDLGVTHLVTIGGDDTAYSAAQISFYAKKNKGVAVNIVHVPKTIDNDLPLPEGVPTFGFETAREVGANIVENLMEDAKTTGRWYFAIAMGRTAGHLALGIGKSSGATVTIIPEEFDEGKVRLQKIVDILVGSIIKRLASDRNHGVAVIAEGVIEKISPEDLMELDGACRDDHGHIRYSEINFGELIKRAVDKELKSAGIKMTLVDKEIGYELRCAPPIAFDIEYTRNLGFAAFDFLRNGGTDAMITIQNNQIEPLEFDKIRDPATGKTKIRLVNIDSVQYQVAREFMIRLEEQDLNSSVILKKMALLTRTSPDNFIRKYQYITQ